MNRGKKPANTGSGSPVRKGGEDVTELAAAKADRWTLGLVHAIFQAIQRPELHP